jgi:hypothetical protein
MVKQFDDLGVICLGLSTRLSSDVEIAAASDVMC